MVAPHLIDKNLIDKVSNYFPVPFVSQGKSILENSQISISFQKGNSDRFFTISGLILLNPKYETRLSFKKEPLKISSQCSCNVWNQNNHCPHVAALFFNFLVNEKIGDEGRGIEHLGLYSQGVHPAEYGTIVYGANRLPGAHPNSTYSSLQYTLTNNKVVLFPLPKELKAPLLIKLFPANQFKEFEHLHLAENKIVPRFELLNDNDEVSKISLFEYLYIFDWKTGEAYHQHNLLKNFIRSLKGREYSLNYNDYFRLTRELRNQNIVKLYDGEEDLADKPMLEFKFRFKVEKSKRKNYLRLSIETFDENFRIITPPEFFSLFVYNNGALNSFRTKNDAEDFITALLDSLYSKIGHYKKYTHGSEKRQYLAEWIDYIIEEEKLELYSPETKSKLVAKSEMIRVVLHSIFNCFGTNTFRFSQVDHGDKIVYYDILKSNFFEGVASFYNFLSPFGIEIYYNDFQVKNWTSSIRFERNQSNLDWFELNMNISDSDLDVIKKADFNQDFLVTQDKLILLSKEQKKLLKFMKKYTKFESTEKQSQTKGIRQFLLTFKRARIFELFELKKLGIEGALTEEEMSLCEGLLNLENTPNYPLPASFVNIARHYQVDGYRWLRFLFENKFGACLADDMGLGKTLQTIMFLDSIIEQVNKVLIICPVSILMNWENEIRKFSKLGTSVYYGDDRNLESEHKIYLTSYGVMKKESYEQFSNIKFDIVIFDEVQQLKNIRSLGASAARNLNSKFRICLTGTPVENDLSEFYNIMDLCVPGVWGELGFVRSSSSKKSRLLARQTVRPFILRRTKEQVLQELPDKEEQYIYLPFEEEEQQNYTNRLTEIKEQIQNVNQQRKHGEILKNLLALRQLCLWQKNSGKVQSTKINFLIESLEQIQNENHKVIIFSQFTTYLDLIQKEVKKKQWKFSRIDGSQNMKKRHSEVDKFQNGDSSIFLISLKAGGFGLNLTAASYIFLMDPWWNPAVENQAIDRAHRIGQENKLTVYRPIIKNSVEEKDLILQQNKKELFSDLMAEDQDSFYDGKLSMVDFQKLLE